MKPITIVTILLGLVSASSDANAQACAAGAAVTDGPACDGNVAFDDEASTFTAAQTFTATTTFQAVVDFKDTQIKNTGTSGACTPPWLIGGGGLLCVEDHASVKGILEVWDGDDGLEFFPLGSTPGIGFHRNWPDGGDWSLGPDIYGDLRLCGGYPAANCFGPGQDRIKWPGYDNSTMIMGTLRLMEKLSANGSTGEAPYVLHGGTVPFWDRVDLYDVSGILPLGKGGTGVTTAGDDTVLVGSGTAWVQTSLPDSNAVGEALRYDTSTNTFSKWTFPTGGSCGAGSAETADVPGWNPTCDAHVVFDNEYNTFTASATFNDKQFINYSDAGGIDYLLFLQHTDSDSAGSVGLGASVLFQLENGNSVLDDAARIDAVWTNVTSNQEAADLVFYVSQAGAVSGEAMRYDAMEGELEVAGGLETGGNVGIGTDPTSSKLTLGLSEGALEFAVKTGNNGTVTCDAFCAGAGWGGYKGGCLAGKCVGGTNNGKSYGCTFQDANCSDLHCLCSKWGANF